MLPPCSVGDGTAAAHGAAKPGCPERGTGHVGGGSNKGQMHKN